MSSTPPVKSDVPLEAASGDEDERVVASLTDSEIEKALEEMCCKKCFGRGFIGWTLNDDPILCECVKHGRKVRGG